MTQGKVLRLAVGLLLLGGVISAKSPKLYSKETDHVKVFFYDPQHEYLVEHLIRCFETALQADTATFHFKPSEKVSVLLQDFGDFGFGSAGAVPKNSISVGL